MELKWFQRLRYLNLDSVHGWRGNPWTMPRVILEPSFLGGKYTTLAGWRKMTRYWTRYISIKSFYELHASSAGTFSYLFHLMSSSYFSLQYVQIECYKEGGSWEVTKLKAVGKRGFFSAIVLWVSSAAVETLQKISQLKCSLFSKTIGKLESKCIYCLSSAAQPDVEGLAP